MPLLAGLFELLPPGVLVVGGALIVALLKKKRKEKMNFEFGVDVSDN